MFSGLESSGESEVRRGEKQALSGVILTAGAAKYQSATAGLNKDSPLQDQTLTILARGKKQEKKKKEEASD